MSCTIITGGQWGDEGKGKFASYLALADQPAYACRAGLGPGAGHTVVHQGVTHKLRQVPSAFVNAGTRLRLGAGVLINPSVLLEEIERLGVADRIGVDPRATVIDPEHVAADRTDPHLTGRVQTTGSGHGPCLAARAMRTARLAGEVPGLAPYLVDVSAELNEALDRGESVHVEGTNGFLLSVLYGTYPYTVSKDSTAATAAADAGLGPTRIDEVVLVFKAFPTRVGGGDFPTEMDEAEATERGFVEHGTVTGRRRRVGRFDFDLARRAAQVNGATQVAVSFLDRLDPGVATTAGQEDLSQAVTGFLERLEKELAIPATLLGTGPDSRAIIDRRGTARS